MALRHAPDATIRERIRTRRQLLGLSVRHAADRAGLSPSTWSRIENGKISADNRFTIAAIAEALRCPVSELTGQPPQPVDQDQAETGGAVYETMRAVVEVDLAYRPPYERDVSLSDLEREVDLIGDLRARCDYIGAIRRVPDLLRDLHVAAFGPSRESALRLLVVTNEFVGHNVRYLGHPASACLIAERAQQAAEALGDPVILGLAAYSRAHGAAGCGLYRRAFMLSETAAADLEGHGDLPDALPMRGQLLLTAAFASYALGDVSGAATRVAEAQDIANHTGQSSSLRLNFGPTNINFWQVSMETDGGEPGRALEIANATNPTLVESLSRQAAFYLDTGRALARLGRDREAVRMLVTAERMAPQRVRNNPLVVETARDLLERSQRDAVGAELRGLAERVGVLT
jgi:transcriptional regulator with XRE-family HTH domain